MSPLHLTLTDYLDPTRWRWVLSDDAGRFLADHDVRLDPASREYRGFCDLRAYLDYYAPIQTVETQLAELGAWVGEQVFGGLRDALRRTCRLPATSVQVTLPAPANALLLRPFELACFADGTRFDRAGVRFIYHLAATPGHPCPPVTDALRILAAFSLPVRANPLNLRRERYGLQGLVRELRQAQGRAVELRVLHYGATRANPARRAGRSPRLGRHPPLRPRREGRPAAGGRSRRRGHHRRRRPGRPAGADRRAAQIAHPRRLLQRRGQPRRRPRPTGPGPHAGPPGWRRGRGAGGDRPDRPARPGADPLRPPGLRGAGDALSRGRRLCHRPDAGPVRQAAGQRPPPARRPAPGPRRRPGGGRPPLSPFTPLLVGAPAAALSLAPPPLPPQDFALPQTGLGIAFPAEPARFVGRLQPLLRASQALAPRSARRGVLFYGMPGAGKTTCALELAYRHAEGRFQGYVWYRAPEAGSDIAGELFNVLFEISSASSTRPAWG